MYCGILEIDQEETIKLCAHQTQTDKNYNIRYIGIKMKNFRFSIEKYNELQEVQKTKLHEFLHSNALIKPPDEIYDQIQWKNSECDCRTMYTVQKQPCAIEYFLRYALMSIQPELFHTLLHSVEVINFTSRLAVAFLLKKRTTDLANTKDDHVRIREDMIVSLLKRVKIPLKNITYSGISFLNYAVTMRSYYRLIELLLEHGLRLADALVDTQSIQNEYYPLLLTSGCLDPYLNMMIDRELAYNDINNMLALCKRKVQRIRLSNTRVIDKYMPYKSHFIRKMLSYVNTPLTEKRNIFVSFKTAFLYFIENGFLEGNEFESTELMRKEGKQYIWECDYTCRTLHHEIIQLLNEVGIEVWDILNRIRSNRHSYLFVTTSKFSHLCNAYTRTAGPNE